MSKINMNLPLDVYYTACWEVCVFSMHQNFSINDTSTMIMHSNPSVLRVDWYESAKEHISQFSFQINSQRTQHISISLFITFLRACTYADKENCLVNCHIQPSAHNVSWLWKPSSTIQKNVLFYIVYKEGYALLKV